MIAAVTGGTGFIGAALVAALRRHGFSDVRVLSRRSGGDLLKDDLRPFLDGADVLFHCAGELRREEAMRALHVEGTRRLIEAARGRVKRWVQLSSVGAYGRGLREGTIDERSPLAPEGEYERTKVESDALVDGAVILRPSIVFGPGMPNRSLHQLVHVVRRGLFFFVGRGAVANYVYVDDVADALVACAVNPAARGTYVLSDDRPMEAFIAAIDSRRHPPTIPEWAARGVAALLGWVPGFPLTPSRVNALSRKVRYSSARIQRELGYAFGVSIEEGLRRFLAS